MIRRLFATSAVDVYVLAAGLVSLTVTARLLGPDGRGLFVVGTSIAALFGALSGMSVDRVLIFRAVAVGTRDWSQLFAELLLFWLMVVACMPIVLVPIYAVGRDYLFPAVDLSLYLWVLILSALIVWQQLFQALLLVSDNVDVFNRSKFVGATATSILVIAFVAFFSAGVMGAIAGVVCGRLIEIAWAITAVRSHVGLPRIANLTGVLELLGHGLKLHVNTVGNVLRTHADVLMLNAFLGSSSAGLFQLATRLIDFMLIIPSAAARLFQGQIVSLGPSNYWHIQKRLMGLIILVLLGGSLAAYYVAPLLVPEVFGVEFSASATYFQWLLPIVLGKAYGVMMATQAISRGYLWVSSGLGIGVAVLNVALNFVLIPNYGIAGAIGASVISFGLVPFLINTLFFVHYERTAQ